MVASFTAILNSPDRACTGGEPRGRRIAVASLVLHGRAEADGHLVADWQAPLASVPQGQGAGKGGNTPMSENILRLTGHASMC